jgi:hypothetical protein
VHRGFALLIIAEVTVTAATVTVAVAATPSVNDIVYSLVDLTLKFQISAAATLSTKKSNLRRSPLKDRSICVRKHLGPGEDQILDKPLKY